MAPDTVLPGAHGTELANGVGVSVSDERREMQQFFVRLPAGVSTLTVRTSGGTSVFGGGVDVDLYARHAAPVSTSNYDHQSAELGSVEEIVVSSPAAGNWYFGVLGLDPYEDVQLLVSW